MDTVNATDVLYECPRTMGGFTKRLMNTHFDAEDDRAKGRAGRDCKKKKTRKGTEREDGANSKIPAHETLQNWGREAKEIK